MPLPACGASGGRLYQGQGIAHEPLKPRGRGGIQLLHGLIDFQGERTHAGRLAEDGDGATAG